MSEERKRERERRVRKERIKGKTKRTSLDAEKLEERLEKSDCFSQTVRSRLCFVLVSLSRP